MEKLYTLKTFLKMAGGRMYCIYPLSYPPPGSVLGHKLQKPSKVSGIFQSLGTTNFFCKWQSQRGQRWHNAPLNTLLDASVY